MEFRHAHKFSFISDVLDDSGLDSEPLLAPSSSCTHGANQHRSENPGALTPPPRRAGAGTMT